MAAKKIGSTEDVRQALKARFAAPAWAVLEEVGNATGFRTKRHIDMIAVSLWPSRGLELHGVEIKSSRQDVMRELSNPAKAEAIQVYCHRWWLAVSDKSLVKPGELPPTWGLLVLRGKKMVCAQEAPALKPKPLDMPFVAALLRRASEAEQENLKREYNRGHAKGVEDGPEEVQRKVDQIRKELDDFKSAVKRFEEQSGIQIDRWAYWDMGDVGEIVARIRRVREGRYRRKPLDEMEVLEIGRRQVAALESAAAHLSQHIEREAKELAIVEKHLKEAE